jgi:poly-gamma-glutamate capsule biosynthesis protein CapA/YwtB (metallophosphatase superfamily)
MRGWIVAVVTSLALSGCGSIAPQPAGGGSATPSIRIVFAGDVMLGRGVSRVARFDPQSVFAGARLQLTQADLTVANLESPLTWRSHLVGNPNALEASPQAAHLLADAGFDAMAIANNHAGDAGRASVTDTVVALRRAGLRPIGRTPRAITIDRNGLTVALLAFDASAGSSGIGSVARWHPRSVRAAVRDAATRADIVAVALHGGIGYSPVADSFLMGLARRLARWGADIVWCHGPHVVQPVVTVDPDHDGRATVVATSLGNLVFDRQGIPGTDRGVLLEVRADADGVSAFRVGETSIEAGRVTFRRWLSPAGDAVASDGSWWAMTRPAPIGTAPALPDRMPSFPGEGWVVIDTALGDVNGDGHDEVIVSFRWPFSPGSQTERLPWHRWVDRNGMKAVVGVYRAEDLEPLWIATSVLRPVARVIPCGSALVVAYSTLDDPTVVATGLWPWRGFGFTSSVDLPGTGSPGCLDVTGDGIADPVVTRRSLP